MCVSVSRLKLLRRKRGDAGGEGQMLMPSDDEFLRVRPAFGQRGNLTAMELHNKSYEKLSTMERILLSFQLRHFISPLDDLKAK